MGEIGQNPALLPRWMVACDSSRTIEDAPVSNSGDAILDYLTDWNEILWQVYPDYAPTGSGNLLGSAVGIDQAFIMQMLIPAFEARGWTFDPATGTGTGLDIRGVANALSINEDRIITHASDATSVGGTSGTDFFYMTAGDQTLTGGSGADFYFVGGAAGNDVIRDQDTGGDDELRFTAAANDNQQNCAWRGSTIRVAGWEIAA